MSTDEITVTSDVTADGAYVAVLTFRNRRRVLDDTAAARYARTVLNAVATADYDAAVFSQMTGLNLPPDVVAQVVKDLRADRPPLDDDATAPLSFAPGVSHRDGRGFIGLWLDGEQVGQLELDAARDHALHVLEVPQVAVFDNLYRQLLVSTIGLPDRKARAVVHDLARHRLYDTVGGGKHHD